MSAEFGPVVQLVRTPPCHGGGHEFESRSDRHFADLAHLVERHLAKVEVASSSLVIRSTRNSKKPSQSEGFFELPQWLSAHCFATRTALLARRVFHFAVLRDRDFASRNREKRSRLTYHQTVSFTPTAFWQM